MIPPKDSSDKNRYISFFFNIFVCVVNCFNRLFNQNKSQYSARNILIINSDRRTLTVIFITELILKLINHKTKL